MTDAVPDDLMKRAEEAYHRQLLRYDREDGIAIIARALMEERAAERERAKAHWLQWHQKRMGISRAFWLSASKAALDGDLRELRNRVALAEAEPVQLVLSEGQP